MLLFIRNNKDIFLPFSSLSADSIFSHFPYIISPISIHDFSLQFLSEYSFALFSQSAGLVFMHWINKSTSNMVLTQVLPGERRAAQALSVTRSIELCVFSPHMRRDAGMRRCGDAAMPQHAAAGAAAPQ